MVQHSAVVYTHLCHIECVCVCVCSRLSAVPDSRATSLLPLLTPWDSSTHTFPSTRFCTASVLLDWVQPLSFLLILPSHNNDGGRFPLYFSECKTHFFSTFSQEKIRHFYSLQIFFKVLSHFQRSVTLSSCSTLASPLSLPLNVNPYYSLSLSIKL